MRVFKAKCTRFDFGWGSAQTIAYSALAVTVIDRFKGPTSNTKG